MESDRLRVAQRHLDFLRIKSFSGHSVDELIELQSVEHRRLPSAVQPKDDDVKALEGRQAREDRRLVRESIPHCQKGR